jgi:hypothetical protein
MVNMSGAVAARQHDIGEVDRLLPGRSHVEDARRRALLEQRKQ